MSVNEDYRTEFDISGAKMVVVDGSRIKEEDGDVQFECMIEALELARFKLCLESFTSMGSYVEGGIGVINVQASKDRVHNLAQTAITHYNNLIEEGKLKLEKVDKVNYYIGGLLYYFLTFSAINIDTGKTGCYQALLGQKKDQTFVLCLLRDCSLDKVLAVLSVTGDGVEERLEKLRNTFKEAKDYENARLELLEAHEPTVNLEDTRKQDRDPIEDLEDAKKRAKLA